MLLVKRQTLIQDLASLLAEEVHSAFGDSKPKVCCESRGQNHGQGEHFTSCFSSNALQVGNASWLQAHH
jgi:hypothetical protein